MKGISIKRFECYLLYLLSIHVAALFIFFIFRFTLFCSIDYQFPAEIKGDVLLQSGAFLRGLWFDNVIACYILLLPLVVLWIAALCNYTAKWLFRFTTVYFSCFYSVSFVIAAANIPYFEYFFKTINSSIYNWFGYGGTTAGLMFGESSYYFPIFLYKNEMLDELTSWLRSFKVPHKDAIRVACIGNSITYGARIKNRDRDSYPAVLSRMLGEAYWVKNFGVSARTLLNKGDHPYMNEKAYQDALAFNPNIVVIKLGTNDSKSFNWKYKADFTKDLQTMVDAFKALPAQPKIYLCYPSKAYQTGDNINDDIISKQIIPMIKKVAKKNNLSVIDLHAAMDGMPQLFPDKIHPNEEGAKVMAKAVYQSLKK